MADSTKELRKAIKSSKITISQNDYHLNQKGIDIIYKILKQYLDI